MMLCCRILLMVSIVLAASFAAAQDKPSHCADNEKTIFTCATGAKKVLSVCASKDFSEKAGYLQYRFGPKGAPELAWPPITDASRNNIEVGQARAAREIISHIRFKKGSYHYIVFDAFGAEIENRKGVLVQKDGKKIAVLLCKSGTVSNNLEDFTFKKYGLTEDQADIYEVLK